MKSKYQSFACVCTWHLIIYVEEKNKRNSDGWNMTGISHWRCYRVLKDNLSMIIKRGKQKHGGRNTHTYFQFSRSVASDSVRPYEPQHARPPCPSPIPGVYPNSCPLSRWCHPPISCSVVLFSSCPQSFPASGSFQMSQLSASGGQSIGSFSVNISPSNEHLWFISLRMDWLDLLAVQGTL